MPPTNPTILFDRPNRTYAPGDTVTGTVTFNNSKPLSARKINVNVSGISRTMHKKGDSISSQRIFIKKHECVWSSEDGKNKMPTGTHAFPFSATLPMNCPPSFKGSHGENKYMVECLIECPWKLDQRVEAEFLVVKKLELSVDHWTKPFTGYKYVRSTLFGRGRQVEVQATIPKRAFYPGETTELQLSINNSTSMTIQKFHISFLGQAHYHSCYEHIPCKFPWNHTCKLGLREKIQKANCFSTVVRQEPVEPDSRKELVVPYTIPLGATSANFVSGLITFGYVFNVEFWMEGLKVHGVSLDVYVEQRQEEAEEVEEVVEVEDLIDINDILLELNID